MRKNRGSNLEWTILWYLQALLNHYIDIVSFIWIVNLHLVVKKDTQIYVENTFIFSSLHWEGRCVSIKLANNIALSELLYATPHTPATYLSLLLCCILNLFRSTHWRQCWRRFTLRRTSSHIVIPRDYLGQMTLCSFYYTNVFTKWLKLYITLSKNEQKTVVMTAWLS